MPMQTVKYREPSHGVPFTFWQCEDGTYAQGVYLVCSSSGGALGSESSPLQVQVVGGAMSTPSPIVWPSEVPVSGTVSVSNFPAFPETQVVSGSVTATVSGTVAVSNFPATQPVSIASPVAVTGTFWQATQPVSGTFWQATQPVSLAAAVSVTGTFWQATQPVSIAATVAVAGNVAHDAIDSGNPVKAGGKATGLFTFPAAVASADRADLLTDLYGRLIVVARPDDVRRLGVYYYHSGNLTVAQNADAGATSGGGRVWVINPVGSAVTVRIRKVAYSCQAVGLITLTSPRITLEKCTFTGTASGSAITAAKRRTADASAVGAVRTASTGMTITSPATVHTFLTMVYVTGVGGTPPYSEVFEPGLEDYLDLAPGECLVVRQADAGTLLDTRQFTVNFVIEEF